jgi:transcriptional regulator GlxA family with amidase domain
LAFTADATIELACDFDTILIPGGSGLRQPGTLRLAAKWLATQAKSTRRIASVSTGIYALAESGLVDRRAVATHWRFARDVSQRFPKVRVTHTASFLKNDQFYTSAGGTAGVEMTLAMIEEDCGGEVARNVARELVMRLRPPAEDDVVMAEINYESDPMQRVADLPAWILTHLHEKMTVDELATRACLCPRHFSRVFKQVFNCTPADFVEELRLTEARRRLLGVRTTMGRIAECVGFKSADAFRRAFERRIGVTPTAFRRGAAKSALPGIVPHHYRLGQPPPSYLKQVAAA